MTVIGCVWGALLAVVALVVVVLVEELDEGHVAVTPMTCAGCVPVELNGGR